MGEPKLSEIRGRAQKARECTDALIKHQAEWPKNICPPECDDPIHELTTKVLQDCSAWNVPDRAALLAWLDEAREIIERLKADARRHGYTTHKADDFLAKLD